VASLEKLRSKGKKIRSLENRPELFDDLRPYVEIYTALHRTRQSGMGPCPLRMDDIVAALDFYGIDDPDERHEALSFILDLDETWLAWAQEQSKK